VARRVRPPVLAQAGIEKASQLLHVEQLSHARTTPKTIDHETRDRALSLLFDSAVKKESDLHLAFPKLASLVR
jgi:hypothetical protein